MIFMILFNNIYPEHFQEVNDVILLWFRMLFHSKRVVVAQMFLRIFLSCKFFSREFLIAGRCARETERLSPVADRQSLVFPS